MRRSASKVNLWQRKKERKKGRNKERERERKKIRKKERKVPVLKPNCFSLTPVS